MFRIAVIAMTCASLVLAGCQVSTAPSTVLEAATAGHLTMTTSPWIGEFRLYAVPPSAKDALGKDGKPITSIHLVKGEKLGFRKRQDKSVVAVAGAQETLLADGKYAWVMQADAGQIDPVKTTILVVVITVVVTVGVVAILFAIGSQEAAP
jgi:hypothetical protein